jgi:hypothetical protein
VCSLVGTSQTVENMNYIKKPLPPLREFDKRKDFSTNPSMEDKRYQMAQLYHYSQISAR